MLYRYHFQVAAPLSKVVNFHAQAGSMGAITPPPVLVRVNASPEHLGEGDVMDFTLWLLFLPLHWVARIEQVSTGGFTDIQLSGPFESWRHRHDFVSIDDRNTLVNDTVEATLSANFVKRLLGLGLWLSLPLLFIYRGWKTRRLLEEK